MGIRVSCPNGHRLHVKAHLAGRRGICPDCGARFLIPAITHAEPSMIGQRSTEVKTLPDEASAGTETVPQGAAVATPTNSGEAVTTRHQGQAGAHVWYVRTREGKQYGPADEATMAQWIDVGRVPGNANVWRTGWADWRVAEEISASLPRPLPPPVAAAATEPPDAPPAEPADTAAPFADDLTVTGATLPSSQRASAHLRGRARQRKRLIATWLLILLVVVLAIILVWVLWHGSGGGVATSWLPPATLSHGPWGSAIAWARLLT